MESSLLDRGGSHTQAGSELLRRLNSLEELDGSVTAAMEELESLGAICLFQSFICSIGPQVPETSSDATT